MSSGYLTNLADVARQAGLKVAEQPGWKTRGHGSFRGVKSIVCHHTAGPASGNMPSLRVVTDGRAGLAGPLCNYGLGRDGTVYVVAAGYGWHAGVVRDQSYANDYAIGIEAEATGLVGWPSIQMDAYAQLCAALCDAFDLSPDRVLGHKEVCAPRGRKSDPNFDMDQFRTRVRNASGLDQEVDEMADPKVQALLKEIADNTAATRKAVEQLAKNEKGRHDKVVSLLGGKP